MTFSADSLDAENAHSAEAVFPGAASGEVTAPPSLGSRFSNMRRRVIRRLLDLGNAIHSRTNGFTSIWASSSAYMAQFGRHLSNTGRQVVRSLTSGTFLVCAKVLNLPTPAKVVSAAAFASLRRECAGMLACVPRPNSGKAFAAVAAMPRALTRAFARLRRRGAKKTATTYLVRVADCKVAEEVDRPKTHMGRQIWSKCHAGVGAILSWTVAVLQTVGAGTVVASNASAAEG